MLLVELGSVGIALTPRLQDSTAAAVAELVVVPVVEVAELVLGAVEPVAVLDVPALVELLLELPQPASRTPAASGTNSQVKSVRISAP
ncbi:MAG TPA: hypothetical protein VG188_04495 [Solirubrobacteraceae bacterium]|nr:hypothetical protein [Solirubrobacteraceae bacterium]